MATIKYKDENGQWQEIAIGGESTEVIDNLESESTTAALSANQGKVLKEMIGQAGDGVKMYQVYLDPANDAEKAVNVEAYNAIKNSEDAVFYYNETADNTTIRHSLTTLVSTDDLVVVQLTYTAPITETSDTDSNGIGEYGTKFSLRLINSNGSTTALMGDSEHRLPTVAKVEEMISEAGGTAIEVDTAMSDESTNPVQNRIVKSYIDNLIGGINPMLDSVNGEVI